MSNSADSINREHLLKLLGLLRPALATQDYIPAYRCVRFAGGYLTAFNDTTAILLAAPAADLDLGRCLPGDMLIRTLNSFNAESVLIQEGKGNEVVVSSGRSRLTLQTIPAADFPLKVPEGGKFVKIEVDQAMLKGIGRCLVSVGNDPTRPATMGVTLESDEKGFAVLYSTDNATMSRFRAYTKLKLPGDAPVILPTIFCEQLISLSRLIGADGAVDLELRAGSIVARLFDAKDNEVAVLFNKTIADLTPFDFDKILTVHLGAKDPDVGEIPAGLDAAFERALLVLSEESNKATAVEIDDEGRIKMHSKSSAAEASELIAWDFDRITRDSFHLDPTLVLRGLKLCSHMTFINRVMVLTSDENAFTHVIAFSSK